ncbi:MAG: ComEA family DNA-binding protein [Trueperella sp.]|nr:ComEA family DNA-binding protein [Trueperella sp.]
MDLPPPRLRVPTNATTPTAGPVNDYELSSTAELPAVATPAERRRNFAQIALAAGAGDDVTALTTMKRKNRFALDGVSLRWVITMLLVVTVVVLTVLVARKLSVANTIPATEFVNVDVPESAPVAVPEPEGGSAATDLVVVHVSGAVTKPGIVELSSGDRVADAIELAGGLTPQADMDRINLAAEVADGEHIHVLAVDEAGTNDGGTSGASGANSAGNNKSVVNLNKASAEQLETVPGIGPVTAQTIVQWRNENGKFASVDQLIEVPGIGAKTLERLRPYVTA